MMLEVSRLLEIWKRGQQCFKCIRKKRCQENYTFGRGSSVRFSDIVRCDSSWSVGCIDTIIRHVILFVGDSHVFEFQLDGMHHLIFVLNVAVYKEQSEIVKELNKKIQFLPFNMKGRRSFYWWYTSTTLVSLISTTNFNKKRPCIRSVKIKKKKNVARWILQWLTKYLHSFGDEN